MNLVKTWLDAGKSSGLVSNSAVLKKLNKDLGKRVMDNRLYEWRSGAQSIPMDVVNYMLGLSIEFVVKQCVCDYKITKNTKRKIISMLSIPKRTK